MNRLEQRKLDNDLLDFGISVIQNQITYTTNQASLTYLDNRLKYFKNLACELKGSEKGSVSQQDFILLYNVVSHYHDAYSGVFGGSADEEVQFYLASVAQLKDDLWEAKSHV
jgi:hypothetical protein